MSAAAFASLWALLAGCSSESSSLTASRAQSCMQCHNASLANDYSGPGIENPHPFTGADNILCTTCHGGDPDGADQLASHVPPPPEIGDEAFQTVNRRAYFNRLTLTGIDKLPDYFVGGRRYTALDYLQFINPGDLRVVTDGRGCGQCHAEHSDVVAGSLLATEAGILSGATYSVGADNAVPESQGLYEDTAADLAFRAVSDPSHAGAAADVGEVARLLEFPVFSAHGANGPDDIHNNAAYLSPGLSDDINADGTVVTGSPLANLYHEQVAFTCGDCHLGSAGANNRYGDFRSSGCSACHMPYSPSGRSGSSDPNIVQNEPLDPDDIDEPERAHVRSHRIVSIAKTLPSGVQVEGMDDMTCAGCHQGSNRTVMQFWGIRLDQNQDVRRGNQYPSNPASWQGTHNDPRLFDPAVGNHTFNGRNGNQYLAFEDYDGDGRDDTPDDVHHEAGMGCIDCHGSWDLHGGDTSGAGETSIASRMEQDVAIRCEDCHGGVETYATTTTGTTYGGQTATVGTDSQGNLLRHVTQDLQGNYWLTSRLTGAVHYLPQTRDTVESNGRRHPTTNELLYSKKASYAMGRVDGNPATGIGPQQSGGTRPNFCHSDTMDCASCHAAWTNTCMGCHLEGEYNTGNNFSNITGERIVFREKNAEFVYQSPLFFQLGIGPRGKITQMSSNTKMFFKYEDQNNTDSEVFAFADRNGGGQNGGSVHGALGHNAMMAHSIRGKVSPTKEGPRYCSACHLTDDGMAAFVTEYGSFQTAIRDGDYGDLDYGVFRQHFGENTGNELNSPLWVHMVAGLGSGLFTFDEDGRAVNPLDTNDQRAGCDGVAPATSYAAGRVYYDLDRIVTEGGLSLASNAHPLLDAGPSLLRGGSVNPRLAGPPGASLIQLLADPVNGVVLDSWLDPDGANQGNASSFIGP